MQALSGTHSELGDCNFFLFFRRAEYTFFPCTIDKPGGRSNDLLDSSTFVSYLGRHLYEPQSQLDAFNYFQSGHVRNVLVYLLPSSQSCVLIAFVNPSQNSPDKANILGLP